MKRLFALACALLPGLAFALPETANPDTLNPEPLVLERASADSAVEVPHESTGQKLANALREKGFSVDAAIVAISTLPIVELRGAIPAGHVLLPDTDKSTRLGRDDGRRAARIFFWAVLGNMLPVPFILLLLGPASKLCMKVPAGKKFFDWLFARTRRKTADIEKYETLGLTVFVAIPLPATGAWTGAMAGWLLGMSFAHSLLSIFLGVLIAGVVMTILARRPAALSGNRPGGVDQQVHHHLVDLRRQAGHAG